MELHRPEAEDDFIPISALSHYLYCPRECALIHVEGQWSDNRFTVEGSQLHERVDSGGKSTERDAVRVWRNVPLRSEALRIFGYADTVELRRTETAQPWCVVEYKRGKRRPWAHHEVQICAQAMALEEMKGVRMAYGYIYHASSKRRRKVVYSAELRNKVRTAADEIHAMMSARATPPPLPEGDPRCENCSLREQCAPWLRRPSLGQFWHRMEADESLP